ncbi:LOW QUALITY PROTEIN: hypothetical protein TorRG33x02_290690 [Trema orientale]|uniref:DUF8039 domain-containing protein n=1 Tax=Trema orientale TaxID=63057 RepID=A0A2P5CC65_TREOI|nr:LOW QUALITY PROTEIN: hypothetical protein TorRG33x02_290690 [Trema orientale]
MKKNTYRVIVKHIVDENAYLPIPVLDEISLVEEAIDSIVSWLKHLVILDDGRPTKMPPKKRNISPPKRPAQPQKRKRTIASSSSSARPPHSTFDTSIIPPHVTGMLRGFLKTTMKKNEDYTITIPMVNEICRINKHVIYIAKEDIMFIGYLKDITAPCISVYIR